MDTNYAQDEVEISIKELITILWDGKKVIVGVTIICLLVAMVISFFVIPEKYESYSLLQVTFKNGETQMTQNGTLGKVTSTPVLLGTIEELDLRNEDGTPYSVAKLNKKILVTNPDNTKLIHIVALDEDPEKAALIVESITNNFIKITERSNLILLEEEAEKNIAQQNTSIQSDVEVLKQFGQSIDGANTAIENTDIIVSNVDGQELSYSIPTGTATNDIVRSVTSIEVGQIQIGVSSRPPTN